MRHAGNHYVLKDMTNIMNSLFRLPARFAVFLTMLLTPSLALAQAAGDPQGSSPIVGALAWLQGTLLGTVATTVAVMAVAAIGFMMLTGRMNWRFGPNAGACAAACPCARLGRKPGNRF